MQKKKALILKQAWSEVVKVVEQYVQWATVLLPKATVRMRTSFNKALKYLELLKNELAQQKCDPFDEPWNITIRDPVTASLSIGTASSGAFNDVQESPPFGEWSYGALKS